MEHTIPSTPRPSSPRPGTPRPGSPRRGTAQVLVVVAALLGLVVAGTLPFAHADDLHKKQKHVRGQIHRARADADDSSAALRAATRRLGSARARLGNAQRAYAGARRQLAVAVRADAQVRRQLTQAQAQLTQAQADLARGRQAVADQRDDIGRLAAQDYALGDPGLLKLNALLNTQDPTDLTYRMNAIDTMMVREDTTLSTMQELRDRLASQEQKVAQVTAAVAQHRRQTQASMQRRRQATLAAKFQRNRVAALYRERRAATAQARRARRADINRLKHLQRQEQRIAQRIRERAAHQRGGYHGGTHGYLTRPVPGWITSPYGWRKHPIYGYWGLHNGVDFHAPCGERMVAAASGRVVEAYYSSVYGNRLYIDLGRVNGKNLTIVYNHATGYRVHVGEGVRRGEVVGYAGETGWATGCHLHFITMVNGTPVDPMQFL